MTIAREQLLEIVKTNSPAKSKIVDLASAGCSAEVLAAEAQALQNVLTKKEARTKRFPHLSPDWFFMALMGVLTCAVGCLAYSQWLGYSIIALMLPFSVVQFYVETLRDQITELKAQLKRVSPIAGTDACVVASKYVENGHPTVLAWRDLAIAERGQLYGFDVRVMARLDFHAESKRSEAEQKLALEEACRKAHGLAPASA